jgi:ABC-2 type transport system permease protein
LGTTGNRTPQKIMLKKKLLYLQLLCAIAIIAAAAVFSVFFHFRIDLTSDHRYSLNDRTKTLLRSLKDPVRINIYLDGDLNAGFLRLKRSTAEMLDEFSAYGKKIEYKFIDPSRQGSSEQAQSAYYNILEKRGLRATMVSEKNSDGKAVQKIIFPWAEIISHGDTIPVNLLVNIPGNSGEENLNASTEALEYQLTDALRVLNMQDNRKVAFLEGNGELSEAEVYDATTAISRYFQVDRGTIGTDPDILAPYKVVIIAKPRKPFTEAEKFVIDQYIMKGGRVLWLVDGTQIDNSSLSRNGQAAILPLDVNLSDQLFCYGIRINNNILQDVQCTSMPVNVAREGDQPDFKPMPWYYEPLLIASPYNPATRNIGAVKAAFSSSLDVVGDDSHVKKEALLVTSNASHILAPPAVVDLRQLPDPKDRNYFAGQNIPVAACLNGNFTSVFANRLVPEGIRQNEPVVKSSMPTRMIVVANGDIIRNDVSNEGGTMQALPLGFDRYMNRQFGNRDFIVNCVLTLAGDDDWLSLRSREIKLRLLNKMASTSGRTTWQMINVLTPLLLLGIFAGLFFFFRKRKFA